MNWKRNRSDYRIAKETDSYIYIEDLDLGNRSVTNDAELVVMDLFPRLKGRRLLYKDSMGEVDEILIKNGQFAGFAPWRKGLDEISQNPE